MQVGIDFGLEHLDVEVRESALVATRRESPAPSLADPAAALRAALETPLRFPSLSRALTPDDHVVIVVDEHLPHRQELLQPLLEHLVSANVAMASVTLLFTRPASRERWVDPLPPDLHSVQIEVHDPEDRRRLAYLATTKSGRRIYLNRTAVDADQVVVLSRRGYDPLGGYSGAELALYPALSDAATRSELWKTVSLDVPGEKPRPVQQEALEVAWLLGAPFLVQVIEGPGDTIAHIVGGMVETSVDGQQLLNSHWRIQVDRSADTVVASMSGDPAAHDFSDVARALGCAARVVKPRGKIVLLSRAAALQGPGVELLRQASEPEQVLRSLRERPSAESAAALQWTDAVQHATVYLLSGLPDEVAEELFTTPLTQPSQVQRLLGADGLCLFLPDAHKMLAVAPTTG